MPALSREGWSTRGAQSIFLECPQKPFRICGACRVVVAGARLCDVQRRTGLHRNLQAKGDDSVRKFPAPTVSIDGELMTLCQYLMTICWRWCVWL
jgi:hypothetical protein